MIGDLVYYVELSCIQYDISVVLSLLSLWFIYLFMLSSFGIIICVIGCTKLLWLDYLFLIILWLYLLRLSVGLNLYAKSKSTQSTILCR